MSSPIAFRRLLAVLQVILAAGLLLLGHYQRQLLLDATGSLSIWDYTAPARELAYVLNAPALLPVVLLEAFLPMPTTLGDILFVIGCGLLWYWIGYGIDNRFGNPKPERAESRPKQKRVVALLGLILTSLLVIFTGIGMATILTVSPYVRVASFLWSLALAGYFGRELVRNRETSTD